MFVEKAGIHPAHALWLVPVWLQQRLSHRHPRRASNQPRARWLRGSESWWRSRGCSWPDTRAALEAPSVARACWRPEWKLCTFPVAAMTHGRKHRDLKQHPLLRCCSVGLNPHMGQIQVSSGCIVPEALGGNQFPEFFPASGRCPRFSALGFLPSSSKLEVLEFSGRSCHHSSLGCFSRFFFFKGMVV